MKLPGFTAEQSLNKWHQHYQMASTAGQTSLNTTVSPAYACPCNSNDCCIWNPRCQCTNCDIC